MLIKVNSKFNPIDVEELRPINFLLDRAKEIERCVVNVTKMSGWREISKCPICNSKEREILFSRFGVNIIQCGNCTTGYAEKFPKDLSDVYNHEDYIEISESVYLKNIEYRKQRFGKERVDIIKKYIKEPPENIKILDIGCGTGWFLEVAKNSGYQVFGQEYSDYLRNFTAKRLGIKVWSNSINRLKKSEVFDVITMFDTIEHLTNPAEILVSIKEHLSSRGICIIFTPNLDSYGFHILKEHSSISNASRAFVLLH